MDGGGRNAKHRNCLPLVWAEMFYLALFGVKHFKLLTLVHFVITILIMLAIKIRNEDSANQNCRNLRIIGPRYLCCREEMTALCLTARYTSELNACSNNVIRRLFGFNKYESVSPVLLGLGRLNINLIMLRRVKFYRHLLHSRGAFYVMCFNDRFRQFQK